MTRYVAVALVAALLAACQSDPTAPEPTAPTKTIRLADGRWEVRMPGVTCWIPGTIPSAAAAESVCRDWANQPLP